MNKEERSFAIHTTTKALLNFIPLIGGPISSLYSDSLADWKEQRVSEFLESLKVQIEANKEIVNSNFVTKVDFLDIFEQTANRIRDERSLTKRIAYKNILLTGALSFNHTYDDLERQIRILDQLSEDHVILLRLFHSPTTFTDEAKTMAGTVGSNYGNVLRKLLPNWEWDYLVDHMAELENMRLLEPTSQDLKTTMMGVSFKMLEGKLTSRGRTFVSFILRDIH